MKKNYRKQSQKKMANEKLIIAFELFETGIALKKQNLLRQYPNLRLDEVNSRVLSWLTKKDKPLLAQERKTHQVRRGSLNA